VSEGYLWAPLLRRELPPGTGEHTIGIVLVPLGGPPRIRVLPGNEDLEWAVAWIRAELAERPAEALADWWASRAGCTEDPVRLGPPAPGCASDGDAEIEAIYAELLQRSPWARG
jgi:hypothetical protein